MNPPVPVASDAGAVQAQALWQSAAGTVALMFWDGVEHRADEVILRQKLLGIWHPVSWRELGQIVREVGMGLASLGFEPGQTAAILSNTRREWMYADLGVLCAGGVSSGIYPTDAAPQSGQSRPRFCRGDAVATPLRRR